MTANSGKYIKWCPRDPWRSGTVVIHTLKPVAAGPVDGFSKDVFHLPKHRILFVS